MIQCALGNPPPKHGTDGFESITIAWGEVDEIFPSGMIPNGRLDGMAMAGPVHAKAEGLQCGGRRAGRGEPIPAVPAAKERALAQGCPSPTTDGQEHAPLSSMMTTLRTRFRICPNTKGLNVGQEVSQYVS